jgi:hypothetical protein
VVGQGPGLVGRRKRKRAGGNWVPRPADRGEPFTAQVEMLVTRSEPGQGNDDEVRLNLSQSGDSEEANQKLLNPNSCGPAGSDTSS